MPYFRSGTHVITREILHGRVWTARPVTIVQDTSTLLALYMTPGTTFKHPRTRDGGPVPDTMIDDWILIDKVWVGDAALYLSPPNAPYALMLFWAQHHAEFTGWYLNLQEPYRRTRHGFDYLDLELDLVIQPNRTNWHWKDEQKFAKLQRTGRISEEQARALRATGRQVLDQIQHDPSFFGNQWVEWTPPTDWIIPGLPVNWNDLAAAAPTQIK